MWPTLILDDADDAQRLLIQERLRAMGLEVRCAAPAIEPAELHFGPQHRLDMRSRCLYIGPAIVPLTPREYELLHFLLLHPHQLFSRDELIDWVWGATFEATRTP